VETNELGGALHHWGRTPSGGKAMAAGPSAQHYASIGDKNEAFTIIAVKGPPDNPHTIDFAADRHRRAGDVSKSASVSSAVDGYAVGLKYAPEGKKAAGPARQRRPEILRVMITLSLPSTRTKWYYPPDRTRKKQH